MINALGGQVFGSPLDKLLIITVLTSASASTQTTILPTARTTLSMAKWDSIPKSFGNIHPRFFTPTFSTLLMGALSIVWTVALLAFNPNQDVLGDTISALGFAVCFYYGFTGLACAVYFRRDLLKSARNFFLAGLVPVLGGIMMAYVAVKAYGYYNTAGNNYSKPIIEDDEQLEATKKKLLELKPNIRKMWSTGGELTNLFQNHEVVAAMGWPLMTNQLRKINFPVGETIPKENTTGWIDHLMITGGSENQDLAYEFLEYMIEAQTQKKVTDITGYTPANPRAAQFMTAGEVKSLHLDDVDNYQKRLYFWQNVPRRAKYNEIWNEVKAAQ